MLEVLTPLLEHDVTIMHTNGLVLDLPSGLRVRVRFAEIKFSMIDGKLIKRLLGIEAAYCTMCNLSQQQCHGLEFTENGSHINRTIQDMRLVAESLSSATGKIR